MINGYSYWFVNNFQIADNADDEINLLGSINTKTTDVIASKDEKHLNGYVSEDKSSDYIDLVSYKANYLVYDFFAESFMHNYSWSCMN